MNSDTKILYTKLFYKRIGIVYVILKYLQYRKMRRKVRMAKRQIEEEINGNFNQRMAIEIVKQQSRNPNSLLYYAPRSQEYFIRNGEQDIILSFKNIQIINGKYHYDVEIGENTTHNLADYIQRIIERRTQILKIEIESKIKRSLKTIYDQMQGPELLSENSQVEETK